MEIDISLVTGKCHQSSFKYVPTALPHCSSCNSSGATAASRQPTSFRIRPSVLTKDGLPSDDSADTQMSQLSSPN